MWEGGPIRAIVDDRTNARNLPQWRALGFRLFNGALGMAGGVVKWMAGGVMTQRTWIMLGMTHGTRIGRNVRMGIIEPFRSGGLNHSLD